MRKRIIASFAALLAVAGMLSAQQWAPAGDRIKTELWDMPHSCGIRSQECVLRFFQKYL